ncbi:MAG TPA: hypothetical protein DDW52_27800 [Planctomycetaceae bacterium]|nr:hypothetical protein [Planctomycetaceae bacterium]
MIELLCTFTGIMAGIAVVASLMRQQGSRAKFEAPKPPGGIDPDKIQGIAAQLQAISSKVAANVSEHSENLGKYSGQLAPEDTPDAIIATINEILAANQTMQGKLSDAQNRIEQQTELIEQASQQARTDALTGLSNRRALDEFLTNSIEAAQDDDIVALLLMDIDHFKNFNDSFGHTTGDAVLAAFARAITAKCDSSCFPARFGGEEFAVILSGKNSEEIVQAAADIRHHVSEQVISYDDMQLKITASGGVCLLSSEDDLNAAYERADQGLYKSKEAGRNCGHWLEGDNWVPFPAPSSQNPQDEPEEVESPPTPEKSPEPADSVEETRAEFKIESAPPNSEVESADFESQSDDSHFELLDVKTFVERINDKLGNIRRGELAATGLMVEALGLKDADAAEAATSWEHTIALIQTSLRGIDVVCQFRGFCLCVFLPGCNDETALERAAQIQASLPKAKDDWPEIVRPERFAISVAQVSTEESPKEFLDRLESSLDEAIAAGGQEIAVHNGDGCKLQAV